MRTETLQKEREVPHRKGSVDILIGLAIGIGVLMLIVVVMAELTTDVQATQTAGTAAHNVTTDALDAFQTFGDFFNVYVLVGILVGIIALFSLIGIRRKRGGFT